MATKQIITQEESSTGAEEQAENVVDQVLETSLKDFKLARDYAKGNYWDTWSNCWALYNGKRVRQSYNGVSNTFVPMVFSTTEAILSHVAGGKPKFQYLPTLPQQERETKVLNQMADYYWDKNRMSLKVIPWIRDVIMYGTGILMIGWEDGCPKIINVPLKDFFIDPTAKSPNEARYAGYRYLTTREDLEKKMVANIDYDPDNPKSERLVPLYKDLDKVPNNGDVDDDLDKEVKDMLNGSTIGEEAKGEQWEIVYVAYKDHIIEIANRAVVIRNDDTPFKREAHTIKSVKTVQTPGGNEPLKVPLTYNAPEIKPFLPFIVMRNYIDASLIYGMGDVEVIADLQEDLNDTTNMKRDNMHYIVNHAFTLDPEYAEMAPEIEMLPGAVFPLPEGALRPIETMPMGADADNEMFRLKQDIREATAADEVVKGIEGGKPGQTTATEINAQMASAGQRFGLKLQVLENEGYQELADKMFKLVQIFVNKTQIIRIAGKQGIDFVDFNPEDYFGDYEPKVILDTTAKAERQALSDRYSMMAQTMMGNPDVNQRELTQLTLGKVFDLDDDEVQQLMQPMPDPSNAPPQGAPAPAGPQGATPAGAGPTGPPPPDPTTEFIMKHFQNLPEDAKHKVLQIIGLDSQELTPQGHDQMHKDMTMQHTIQDKLTSAADPNTDNLGNPIGATNGPQTGSNPGA